MEQTFQDGDRVVVTKRVKNKKLVKGAKGVIVMDRYTGFGTVSIRFQGTNETVSNIPYTFVKKQFPDPVVLNNDMEVPKYSPNMSNIVLLRYLDTMMQLVCGEKWRYWTRETKQHVTAFVQAVAKAKQGSDIGRMANRVLEYMDIFS